MIKEYVCAGLRVSTGRKKVWALKQLGNLDNSILVSVKGLLTLNGVYTLEHPDDAPNSYYPGSISFQRRANIKDWPNDMLEQSRIAHIDAEAFFTKQTHERAIKRLEKDCRDSIEDLTIRELKRYYGTLSKTGRQALIAKILVELS